MDVLLLGGIAIAAMGACALLAWMAWQAPEMVRAASRPAAPWTATPFPTATAIATATPAKAVAGPQQTDTPTPAATATHAPLPTATATESLASASLRSQSRAPGQGSPAKWIEIDISEQTLRAYEDGETVLSVPVSTGLAHTPTPLGEFAIYARVPLQDMRGPGYFVRDVRYVAYFTENYALHATYWHDNFGQPMSHGCVNMRTADAAWLYQWAPIGTPVRVHP